jgi:hypothetical protein
MGGGGETLEKSCLVPVRGTCYPRGDAYGDVHGEERHGLLGSTGKGKALARARARVVVVVVVVVAAPRNEFGSKTETTSTATATATAPSLWRSMYDTCTCTAFHDVAYQPHTGEFVEFHTRVDSS